MELCPLQMLLLLFWQRERSCFAQFICWWGHTWSRNVTVDTTLVDNCEVYTLQTLLLCSSNMCHQTNLLAIPLASWWLSANGDKLHFCYLKQSRERGLTSTQGDFDCGASSLTSFWIISSQIPQFSSRILHYLSAGGSPGWPLLWKLLFWSKIFTVQVYPWWRGSWPILIL